MLSCQGPYRLVAEEGKSKCSWVSLDDTSNMLRGNGVVSVFRYSIVLPEMSILLCSYVTFLCIVKFIWFVMVHKFLLLWSCCASITFVCTMQQIWKSHSISVYLNCSGFDPCKYYVVLYFHFDHYSGFEESLFVQKNVCVKGSLLLIG